MWKLAEERVMDISIDCIKVCPYHTSLTAIAYYQTDPTTKGAISVTNLQTSNDLAKVALVDCPPLLHLSWIKCIKSDECFLIAAACRSNDVMIYSYWPKQGTLAL